MSKSGAGKRTRTADLLITNQLLYQLSYPGTSDILPESRHIFHEKGRGRPFSLLTDQVSSAFAFAATSLYTFTITIVIYPEKTPDTTPPASWPTTGII